MKKLILILLLLISTYSYGQAVLSGQKGWDGYYNPRAVEFFDRCVTAGVTLTTAQKQWYSDSIFQPLQDSGLIGTTRAGDSIQAIWVLATFPNGSETVCKLNLLSDSNSITNVNSVTFTDSGAVGNGSTSYLNTNFNPVWDSSIYKSFSASGGVYSKSDISGVYMDMGAGYSLLDSTFYINSLNSGRFYTKNNGTYISELTGSPKGVFISSRLSSTIINMVINGNSISKTSNYINKPNVNFYILCFNNQGTPLYYSARVITFAYIGSGLSATKSRALSNILNNSLISRGYNVY
jgi:hypothetical protein